MPASWAAAATVRSVRGKRWAPWEPVAASSRIVARTAPLHAAIHRNLAEALQRALDGGDPFGASCIDHQLVAHRPAPGDVAALDRAQQQIARPGVAASLHPGGGVCQYRAGPVPESDGHQAAGGTFSRSTASRSRSSCPPSIASSSASAATTAVAPGLQLSLRPLDGESAQQRRIGLAGAGGGANPRQSLPQLRVGGDGNSWVLGRHRQHSVARRGYSNDLHLRSRTRWPSETRSSPESHCTPAAGHTQRRTASTFCRSTSSGHRSPPHKPQRVPSNLAPIYPWPARERSGRCWSAW